MRKQLTIAITTMALAVTLAGCGGAGNVATTSPVSFGNSATQGGQVSSADYVSVTQAQQQATDALYQYNDLLNTWEQTNSDIQKDQIENQMLNVLTQALQSIQQTVSSGYGYDARQVYNIAGDALTQYQSLELQWQQAYTLQQKRQIVNNMLTLLTGACKQIQAVQPQA